MSVVRLSAVLLAGGESRRMGRDKATLKFRGKPLWQNQLQLLKQLQPLEILVSARTDPPWRPSECIFVADAPPSRGPLSGIAAALQKMRGTHLLVLAIDLPQMTASYLKSLSDKTTLTCGVVPVLDNRAEPLAAIYPIEAINDFQKALAGSDHSLQGRVHNLAQSGKVRLLPVLPRDQKFFRNLNSPED